MIWKNNMCLKMILTIGVQNDETMQDFKGLGNKCEEIDMFEIISKLNADQRRVFDKVTNTVMSGKITTIH